MSAAPLPLWADGALRGPDERVVHATDPGFLLGLAAFETLLWEDGTLYFVDEHLTRMEHSASGLGLKPAPWEARAALFELCAQLGSESVAVRMTQTPGASGHGPSLFITCKRWTPPDPRGVGVRLVPRAKLAGDPLEGLKTSSRLRNALARATAIEVGAWEALLGTDEGDLAEGCVSNLFAVIDGRLVTPPTNRAALPGIMRDKLIESMAGEVHEERLEPADLARASEVFLTNSLARIAPVSWIHELRDDLPGAQGPVCADAQGRIRSIEARYRATHGADA